MLNLKELLESLVRDWNRDFPDQPIQEGVFRDGSKMNFSHYASPHLRDMVQNQFWDGNE